MKGPLFRRASSLLTFVLLVSGCAQVSSSSQDSSEVAPDFSVDAEVSSPLALDPYDILGRLQASGETEWFVDTSPNLTDIPVEEIYLTNSDAQGNGCAVWVFADRETVDYQVQASNFEWMSENHWWWYGVDNTSGKGIILASNLEFGDCATQADVVFGW